MIQSGNPALGAFQQPARYSDLSGASYLDRPARVMTLAGTLGATGVLLGLCASSALAAVTYASAYLGLVTTIGVIGGLILALIVSFVPRTAPFLSPVYAILMGAALGGISMVYQNWALGATASGGSGIVTSLGDSIVFQAVVLTFGIAGAMLLAYSLRIIRATPMFVRIMSIMLIGYLLASVGTWVARMFGAPIPFLHDMGTTGILIGGGVVVFAALTLILDFKVIEDAIEHRAPKYMEWYGAFGLMVTLVWLYLRVLYLLAMLRRSE